MADFPIKYIDIDYYTDFWGPFTFQFTTESSPGAGDGILPFGSNVAAVNVRVFKGRVTKKSDLSKETELFGVVDPDYVPVVANNSVSVRFQYLASAKGSKATVIFEVTLDSGARVPIYFQYLRIN